MPEEVKTTKVMKWLLTFMEVKTLSSIVSIFNHIYSARCEFTVASKGYAFFTGDEGFYPAILKQDLEKFLGEKAKAPISTETAFQGLQKFFTVFYLHKPYYDPEIDKNLVNYLHISTFFTLSFRPQNGKN